MNKESFIKALVKETGRDEKECVVINDILENHFIVGHNNKEKIKEDLIEKLNITEDEADTLYNICAKLIVTGILK